jgi:hypothetical protein
MNEIVQNNGDRRIEPQMRCCTCSFQKSNPIESWFDGGDYAWQHRGPRSALTGQSGLSTSYHKDFAHRTMNRRARRESSARHFRFPAQFRSKS